MADRHALLKPPAARVLPTLTEVIEPGRVPAAPAAASPGAAEPPNAEAIDEAAIVSAVVHELQQRIDLMFEYRVREALAPLLARAADKLLHEARDELARTLRDVVARAVAQELARHRQR